MESGKKVPPYRCVTCQKLKDEDEGTLRYTRQGEFAEFNCSDCQGGKDTQNRS